MNIWLMKTEPDVFSFKDLVEAPRRTTHWEGVRNYQARNFMRDSFKCGDTVLVYHSNAEPPCIVGIAEVVREAYPDPHALDPKNKYFDEKAKKRGENPWVMVDIMAKSRFAIPVTRPMLALDPVTKTMMVLAKGSRLSIQPVQPKEFKAVLRLGNAMPL